jgi:two-component system cell cycle sensor histidine kinase/response regulator CckA
MRRRVTTRARFVLAAVLATIPLVALVIYSAWDRYDADHARASTRASIRAELYVALLREDTPSTTPSAAEVARLLEVSPLPDGAALAVLDPQGHVVQQAGPASALPPAYSPTFAPLLSRGSTTVEATGADGVARVWGTADRMGAPWAVVYGVPGSSVYGPAESALWRDIWLAGAAVLTAAAMALLLARKVTAPIRRLAARVGINDHTANDLGTIERGISRRDETIAASKLELARRAERLAALGRIDRAILDADTAEDIAQAALDRVREVTGALAAVAVTFNSDRTRATVLAIAAPGPTAVSSGAVFDLDATPFDPEQIVGGGARRVEVDAVRTSSVTRILRDAGIQSCVAAPLAAEDELLGAVALGFVDGGSITDDVLAITGEVAAQLAVALRHAWLRTELQAVVDGAFDAIVTIDSSRRVLSVNDIACELFGLGRDELLTKRIDDVVVSDDNGAVWASFLSSGTINGVLAVEVGGQRREVEIRGRAEVLAGRHLLFMRDVSQHHRLEDRLRQAQKMEAVGRLAGGVAHDFNNLLTAISGYSGLARATIGSGPGSGELDGIDHASQRAAQLTRQLLAFSRQQVLQPVLLDVNEVVDGLMPMVGRLIGEDIEIVIVPERGLGPVRADRGQLEQVIVNLVVNARDAMPTGGILTIETRTATLDESYTGDHAGVMAGRYACLTVTDTGVGMDSETQARVFEPFYTTKDVGRGTGLGLATVHGIVTQSHGHVLVYSELGLGTTFKVYLPLVEAPLPPSPRVEDDRPRQLGGTETILLCEDDDLVRGLLERVLRRNGYTVRTATHPHEALEVASRGERLDALVTDVVMPQMSGPELVERVNVLHPGLRILFLSGYPIEVIRDRGNLPLGSAFLEKPFHASELARVVRELLDHEMPTPELPEAGVPQMTE